jgi:hypothetical protein
VSTSKFCPQKPARKEMGRKMVATSASRRLTTPRCLLASESVQDQQGGTSLLDRGAVGHDLLQLVVDVFGVQLGFAGGAGQGLDERRPGGEVPAWREDPPGDRGPAPYRGDLGQLLVVGSRGIGRRYRRSRNSRMAVRVAAVPEPTGLTISLVAGKVAALSGQHMT